MTEGMKAEIKKYRDQGVNIPGEAVDFIEKLCIRKMEMAGKEPDDWYLELMFKDEVKNYLFREAINAETKLRMIERSLKDVSSVQTDTVSPSVPERRATKAGEYLHHVQGGNIRGGRFLRFA